MFVPSAKDLNLRLAVEADKARGTSTDEHDEDVQNINSRCSIPKDLLNA